jgi:flagellar biogenesis protein FliO
MKIRLIFPILLALALLTALPSLCPAQEQKPAPAPQASVEPLGENDPILFMRSEQTAATEEPSSVGLLLKTFGAMAFIVGLIFVGAWGAKKLGYGNKKTASADGAQLSVITSVSLGNGRTVSTIQFGPRVLLVGSTPQSFTLLAEEDGSDIPEQPVPRSVGELLAEDRPAFRSELNQAESRLNSFIPGGRAS